MRIKTKIPSLKMLEIQGSIGYQKILAGLIIREEKKKQTNPKTKTKTKSHKNIKTFCL